RVRGLTLGVARRHGVAGRREEWMPLVDPLVDDRDLHSLAGVLEPGAPERGRTDLLGAPIELRSVANTRVDLGDARQRAETGELRAGQDDGHAVRDQLVPPAD